MTREQMIEELKSLDLRAIPTIVTMDMGLQYDYATSEGAGSGFGGMGNWPAHVFNPFNEKQWLSIREAIRNKTIALEHLKNTGLDVFVQSIPTLGEELVLSEVLEDLLSLPENLINKYYCLFDTGIWYAKGDNPIFFTSEKQLKDAFIDRYVNDLTRWEDMDEEELVGWHDRIHNEMAELSVYTYEHEEKKADGGKN